MYEFFSQVLNALRLCLCCDLFILFAVCLLIDAVETTSTTAACVWAWVCASMLWWTAWLFFFSFSLKFRVWHWMSFERLTLEYSISTAHQLKLHTFRSIYNLFANRKQNIFFPYYTLLKIQWICVSDGRKKIFPILLTYYDKVSSFQNDSPSACIATHAPHEIDFSGEQNQCLFPTVLNFTWFDVVKK